MRFSAATFFALAPLASFAAAARTSSTGPKKAQSSHFPDSSSATQLDVALTLRHNTMVDAVVSNRGARDVRVLKVGTLLDAAPVEKVIVTSKTGNLAFEGIHVRVAEDHLTNTAFELIPAGDSITVSFDLATTYNLSKGGKFNITAHGALRAAEYNSNILGSPLPYISNTIEAIINGDLVSALPRLLGTTSSHEKRVNIQDCKDTRLNVSREALHSCRRMARAGFALASTYTNATDATMEEYFKDSSQATRKIVYRVMKRVAQECASGIKGWSDYYCSDPYPYCSNNTLAYTLSSESYTAYCDLFFDALKGENKGSCHGQDQGSTLVHEMTHLTQVKGTSDYGGYGYDFIRSLTKEENLNHADTYALFAKAAYLKC